MGFRQSKSDRQQCQQRWIDWIEVHRSVLMDIGLPPEVYLSEAHWKDFLQDGYLELHPEDSTGFSFSDLPAAAAGALRRWMEKEYGASSQDVPLLRWLRVRHDAGQID
jgi:hypothetical protein